MLSLGVPHLFEPAPRSRTSPYLRSGPRVGNIAGNEYRASSQSSRLSLYRLSIIETRFRVKVVDDYVRAVRCGRHADAASDALTATCNNCDLAKAAYTT